MRLPPPPGPPAPPEVEVAPQGPAHRRRPQPTTKVAASSASSLIDQPIEALSGWRGETLAKMRALILEAAPQAIEKVTWGGTPVWSDHGILCTSEASLPDPKALSNSS